MVTSKDWEAYCMVLSPEQSVEDEWPGHTPECPWVVMDAECAFVCRCQTEENAWAIARAVDGRLSEERP